MSWEFHPGSDEPPPLTVTLARRKYHYPLCAGHRRYCTTNSMFFYAAFHFRLHMERIQDTEYEFIKVQNGHKKALTI